MGLNPAFPSISHFTHLRSRDDLFVLLSILDSHRPTVTPPRIHQKPKIFPAPGPRYRENSVVVPQRSVPAPGVSFSEMETPTFNTYYVYHVYISIYIYIQYTLVLLYQCFLLRNLQKLREKKAEPEKIS